MRLNLLGMIFLLTVAVGCASTAKEAFQFSPLPRQSQEELAKDMEGCEQGAAPLLTVDNTTLWEWLVLSLT
jgi:hypothetical protein